MTANAAGPASVLTMPRALSWAMALLLLLETSLNLVHADHTRGSFQNGRIEAALYAGGMDYIENDIQITGITYATNGGRPTKESQCFVTKFNAMNLHRHSMTISRILGDGTVMQSCHAVNMRHAPNSNDYSGQRQTSVVAGTSDPGGIRRSKPSGFLMVINPSEKDDLSIQATISTDEEGQTNAVSYPVSVLYVHENDAITNTGRYKERKNGIVFMASLTSTDLSANPNNIQTQVDTKNQPNWLHYFKYGSSFELGLQKFKTTPGDDGVGINIEHDWTKLYPVDVDETTSIRPDVFVAGMIRIPINNGEELLIVAGSTAGSGTGFGIVEPGSDDIDGFISVFDGRTGELRDGDDKSNIRVGSSEPDLILGICNDHTDSNVFYVVGTTGAENMGSPFKSHNMVSSLHEGNMRGFVQKIAVDTLEPFWRRHWGAKKSSSSEPTIAAGMGCKVVGDGTLYVVGISEDGAHVSRDRNTIHNGDDIVAMRLDTKEGNIQWVTQFGSKDGDENLARSGAIAVDPDGNLVILGDTTGSLFRQRGDDLDDTSDIFLAKLSKKDGSHDATVPANHQGAWHTGTVNGLDHHDMEENIGMLSGGKWTEDEIYGSIDWVNEDGIGIQSGPAMGSIYAGGMVYDELEDGVYLTGIAYDGDDSDGTNMLSSCMVTRLPLSSKDAVYRGWGGADGKIIGRNNVLEVCNSIALHGYNELVVIGSADKGSFLPESKSVEDYPMAGFAMALDRYNLQEIDGTPLVTQNPLNKIQYPVDIVSDGNDMYIVSLTSTDNEKTREFQQLMDRMANGSSNNFSPNWMGMNKYGTSFDMTVTKLTLEEVLVEGISIGDISFTTKWSKEFPMDPDGDGTGTIPRVYLGGLILKKSGGYLAVSGSTSGMGTGYGAATGTDKDGFIVLLDMNTGELSENVERNNSREGTAEDDRVLGMCHDPNDNSSFYVVGGTKGEMVKNDSEIPPGSTQAYLRKIDANNLQTLWTIQVGALLANNDDVPGDTSMLPTNVNAYDCAVSGDIIYAAGIVYDNASILGTRNTNSRGGDDIWVGSFKTDDGHTEWVRQMGSEGDDHIAPRGGMVITKDGSLLIFGDTNGSFYRVREYASTAGSVSELFMMQVKKDGSHKPHVRHPKSKSTSSPVPEAPGTSQSTPPPFLVSGTRKSEAGISTGVLVGLVLVVIPVVVVALYYFNERLTAVQEPDNGQDIIIFAKAPPSASFQNYQDGISNEKDSPREDYAKNLKLSDIL